MCRKRARTSQYGPGISAKAAVSPPLLDINPWQLDSNPPYYGYSNTSTSGPSFKARKTSTGRMPINIPEHSANIKVYEPEEYIQQSGGFTSFGSSPNTRPHLNLNDHYMPSSSLEVPSHFSNSPTTTVSERLTNTTTPCTSIAMSRENSLATSFCGAFEMMRANSGVSEIDSPQTMCRHDSHYNSFSPDGQGVSPPFDPSIYFAHAEGTAIEDSGASTLPIEQLQFRAASDFDTGIKSDFSSFSMPAVEQVHSPSSLDLHTKMARNASSESNTSSISRVSRRSQEQVAQAARPIAPKDVAESPTKQSSSSSSSGQDMLRQRSAPEPKVLIPKLQYNRQAKEKLKCSICNKNPDGYRGSHELHRHMALDHNTFRTAWICVDISRDGFLSGCAACEAKKAYGQDYNAAAHLRRFHFHPRSEIRRTNVDPEEKRGGKGGGKDPPMSECRRWMKKIQVPGKDYTALPDSAVNDAAEDGEENREWEGEQAETLGDSSLPGNVQIDCEPLQLRDGLIKQQISASPAEDSKSLELTMSNDRQFAHRDSDVPFSRSGLPPAFELSFGTRSDSNAASFIAPSTDLEYPHSILSSSAPAAPSFMSTNPVDLAQANDSFGNGNGNTLDPSSTMSSSDNPYSLEGFSNFPTSYVPGNVSYGMSPPNNPHFPNGLLEFPPFH